MIRRHAEIQTSSGCPPAPPSRSTFLSTKEDLRKAEVEWVIALIVVMTMPPCYWMPI